MVDIDSASTWTDFEVIEIVDENSTYPALLGIDWATKMNGIINLKKRKMIFEKKLLPTVILLDPAEGPCYTEPMHNEEGEDDLDCIYKIFAHRPKGDKPIEERRKSWGYTEFCTEDSDE